VQHQQSPFIPGASTEERSIYESQLNEEADKETKMLDLINRVQMFQIAASKAN